MTKMPNDPSAGAAPSKKKGGKKKKSKFKVAFTNKKAAKLLSDSGNKELSKGDLSVLSEEEKLLLTSWGLPSIVLAKYRSKGVTSLFPWQLDCLSNERVLEGSNLLYSAPTSAGKTLVAEILMIKRVLELGRKAIMILPFVSVAREKMYSLQELFGDAGVRVEGFMGSYNPPGGFKSVDIAICTIEKANSLINRLLEEGTLSQLGTVVVDEIHLLGDPHRGYLLELLLTKIKYITNKSMNNPEEMDTEDKHSNLNIQIVGMSATLPNLDVLARWLNAELVLTDFRPVPLVERIKIDDYIYDEHMALVRPVIQDTLRISIPNDKDHVIYLCLETVLDGHSILIFCPSKKMCEQVAEQVAREFYNIGNPNTCSDVEIGQRLRAQLNGHKIMDVIAQLNQCPAGLDETLEKSVAFGVAFHHAGLTFDERDILESSFKNGVLRVMVATSTLSAGVNLPARRVIIRTPNFNGGILDVLTYRQMSGRAGRKGVDSAGESLLICSSTTQAVGIKLIQSYLPPVKSALLGHQGSLTSSMKRAMLEVVASGVAHTPADVHSYSKCTLLSFTVDNNELCSQEEITSSQDDNDQIIEDCLKFLEENEFIRLRRYESAGKSDEYKATQLGSACLASSLSPDEGITVFKELQKARKCFVLENELHVVYQVTPIYLAEQWRNIDWHNYLVIWESLTIDEKKVAALVGVEESFIVRAMMGTVSWRNPKQAVQLSVHQRFFTALALNDLVNEMPIGQVAEKYCVNKGVIQNLQQAASTFAGMVTVFCSRLGWSNLELLLSQFQERLQFGIQRELCDLVRLSLVNGQRARILYDAGVKTIAELTSCEPAQVEHYLHMAGSFSSAVHGGQSSKPLWVVGMNDGLSESEAARLIVQEARQFLQIELGLPENLNYGSKNLIITTPVQTVRDNPSFLKHNKTILKNLTQLGDSDSTSESDGDETDEQNPERIVPPVQNLNRQHIDCQTVGERFKDTRESELKNSEINFFEDSLPIDLIIDCEKVNEQFTKDTRESEIRNDEINFFEDSFPIELMTSQNNVNYDHQQIPDSFHQFNLQAKMDCALDRNDLISTPIVQKHSTPLQSACYETEQEDGHCKVSVEDMSFGSNNDGDMKVGIGNISDILMESITSQMDVSLHISGQEQCTAKNPPMSEELFSSNNENDNERLCEPANACFETKNQGEASCSSSSNEVFHASPEENTTAVSSRRSQSRRKSARLTPRILDEETDKFDLNFLNRKIIKHSFKSAKLDGRAVVVKVVETPEFIPIESFTPNQLVGIGMKLSAPKRIRSLSRCGIGSRILAGKTLSHSVQRTTKQGRNSLENETKNSIAIYDEAQGIIWLYQWTVSQLECHTSGIKSKVAQIFRRIRNAEGRTILLDAKEKLKTLTRFCGKYFTLSDSSSIEGSKTSWVLDPKIAEWLIQPDDRMISLDEMIANYMNNESKIIKALQWPAELLESYSAWKLMKILKEKLEITNLYDHFTDVEMPCVHPLILMEINGFGLNSAELEKLKKYLEFKSALLELRAYQIAGRQFNLSSPKEIRQILFREIGLKEPDLKGTSKDILSKLNHELPQLIIEWRKVMNAIKMMIQFLQDRNLDTGRVHGYYSHFTLSGRVIMTEPSLQCIPRDFDLKLSYNIDEIKSIHDSCRIKFGSNSKLNTLLTRIENGVDMPGTIGHNSSISMRNTFIPCSELYSLMSADYSQLELRILAHLCQDENLLHVLNEAKVDVFKSIAAQWKRKCESEVSVEMRQEAKAVTYGIIYGMGSKALAEQMEISQEEASLFIAEFMRAFPKIRSFIDKTVKNCRENGFVETFCGRKRFLVNINSKKPGERAQAERQAVNFRIQGSASDLVKTAMIRIHANLSRSFPETVNPMEWKTRTKSVGPTPTNVNNVCFPILNLHDELIFEVKESHLSEIARKIKLEMETCSKLNVFLPVVVKTGKTWGTLSPYCIE